MIPRRQGFSAQDFVNADFRALPKLEIWSAAEINGANGAFARATNTIYLSREFLSQNPTNPNAVSNVLLEEIGHYIDSRLNTSDAVGDEGEIFSSLVQGQTVSSQQLQTLKTEDDSAVVNLNGQSVAVEQSLSLVDQLGDVLAPTATINMTYTGFTPAAQSTFQYAVGIWESLIKSPVTIEVQANWTPLGVNELGQKIIGSAGPAELRYNFSNAPVADTWYPIALANSLAGRI